MITHPNHTISLLWKEFLYISLFLAERFICGLNLGLGRSFLRFGVRISLSGRFLALLKDDDLDVQRAALLMVNAAVHHQTALIVGLLLAGWVEA